MSATHKVLVVDDDPVVARSFDRVLSGKGYAVITANNAHEALSKLETEDYDVVFTDIKMPGMSGLEMAEQVKQQRPWLPVVIVTGYGSPGNEARAEAAGVSGFLRKPLSPEMIENSAAKAMSETSAAERTPAPAASVATQQAAAPEAGALRNVGRVVKNVALFLAAPFVGLAYILTFPIVGLGMLAWMGIQAQRKKSEEEAKLKLAPVSSSIAKSTAIFIAAPFIGLAYIIVGPIIGLGMLAWFGFQAWGKMGTKALDSGSGIK